MNFDCSVTKRKGCNYCLRNKTILHRNDPLTQINIENNSLVLADVFGIKGIKINYCPVCGKKFKILRK